MNNLWQKHDYKANIQFLIDIPIQEFDISKANINVLRDADAISEELYQYLLSCPKMEREITIGRMQGKNPNLTSILKDGIANARRIFLESNHIQDSEILSIRNDAITIIGNKPDVITHVSDRINFRLTGSYRSFYRVWFLFMFYNFDIITNNEVLDIKGLGDEGINLHKSYMIDFLSELFYTAQIDGVENALSLLSTVYQDYINMKLPIYYYREFNPSSRYKLKGFSEYNNIYMDFATEYDKRFVDIGWNDSFMREMNKILATAYFRKKQKY